MCEDDIEARCASHAPVASDARFASGAVFGDWRITAFIGRGGSGEVYCAEHVTLGTPAAVKVLVRDGERAKTRFVGEARLVAKLRSDAFPRFFAYGEANGAAYLAMELLEPGDLPTGDRAVARFMLKVCGAVAELHALGLVHRDIKPGNVLWRPCRRAEPILADLGLAVEANAPDIGRRTGAGTPGYSAPEQMERGEATEVSDVHSLGVLADRCFGGKPPRAWKRIIERATSSIPAHRYQDVASFARAIRTRHRLMRMLLILIAAASLAVVALVAWRSVESRRAQQEDRLQKEHEEILEMLQRDVY